MKVVVTGSFGGGDIGDDAMVFPHLRTLAELGVAKSDIWLIGHIPEYMAEHFDHPINRCIKSDPAVGNAITANTDLLLVTGGGTINTRDEAGYSIRRAHRLIKPFVSRGVPIFMSGQTIGPLGVNKEHDRMAKEIIDNVDVLTVRDRCASRGEVYRIGANPRELIETVDDAGDIPLANELPIKLPSGSRAIVNTTLYTYDTLKKQAAIQEVCRRLQDRGYVVLLLPHHGMDLDHLGAVHDKVPDTVLVDTTGWHGTQTKKLIAHCQLVIGGRYHVVVFGMSTATDCVGMAGNHYSWVKQFGFADQKKRGHLIVPPSDVTKPDVVMQYVDRAVDELPTNVYIPPSSFIRFKSWFKEQFGR